MHADNQTPQSTPWDVPLAAHPAVQGHALPAGRELGAVETKYTHKHTLALSPRTYAVDLSREMFVNRSGVHQTTMKRHSNKYGGQYT